MKTFSDLWATKTSIPITICLAPVFQTIPPTTRVAINNNVLYSDLLIEDLTLDYTVDLAECFTIEISLSEKNDTIDYVTGINLVQITIDTVEIIPNWTNLAYYNNDRQFTEPTGHLGFNGTWKLTVDSPFYQWYHHHSGQGMLLKP